MTDRSLTTKDPLPTGTFSPSEAGRLICQHPQLPALAEWPAPFQGLLDPPGTFSTTISWQRWCESLRISIKRSPTNPNWPLLLDASEKILAWRNSIPQEKRFWPAGSSEL